MGAVNPVESVIHEFTKVVRPLLARVARARDESATLSVLRDALLQKLVSGQLRIKDAERFVAVDSKPNELRSRLRAAAP
jgi:type I restriction enzyme S subunit